MWAVLLLCFTFVQTTADTSSVLVLTDGTVMVLEQEYVVDGAWVQFKTKGDQLFQLPLAKVNLEASKKATRERREKQNALVNAKPKDAPPPSALPDTFFEERNGLNTTRESVQSTNVVEASSNKDDYFGFDAAWATFEKGTQALPKIRHTKKALDLKTDLASLSRLIWEIKAAERKSNSLDGSTWENQRRELKDQLKKLVEKVETQSSQPNSSGL